jgi:D-3-phosphoglycerate dehydrogenase
MQQITSQHIAFLTPMAPRVTDQIATLTPAGFTIAFAKTQDRSEHLEMMREADYVIVAGTFIYQDQIEQAGKLKLIQKWGIGVDKIDLEAARAAGVSVAITTGVSSKTVAEHTLLLMLAVYRRLVVAHRSLEQGKWLAPELRTVCYQLAGKTVGLLGFGNIAQHVAKRLAGFDVKVIYHSRTRASAALEEQLNAQYVDYDTLLSQSDILSLHLPLNATTRHQFTTETFKKMKTSAVLINTARGEIIDEQALIQALERGQIAGAGLDTFEGEPPSRDNPLLHMDQVVVTPHSAGAVMDNVANTVGHAFRNIQLFSQAQPIAAQDIIVAGQIPR